VVDTDESGKLKVNKTQQKLIASFNDDLLLKAYELMRFSRIQETLQAKINKEKKVMNFLSSTGQEATEVGYAIHLQKGVD
jgi:pyruvate dehydrogenase E1 component alpha subunit